LAGICDIDKGRLETVSNTLRVAGYQDYRELFGKVDALSVAVPTKSHQRIAYEFLKNGIHTLVEKPFTLNLKEADSLIRLARKNKLILQVGHIERFNSAFNATLKLINHPKFIECHRLSPFPNRSLDVGAVLDIMIHDIDIVLGLVDSRIKRIEAVGVNVLTQFEDIANARITFKNGCVANLTASRISDEIMRKIRIFQEDTYISSIIKMLRPRFTNEINLKLPKRTCPLKKNSPFKKSFKRLLTAWNKTKNLSFQEKLPEKPWPLP
jgi:predicted dehydrogenase